MTASVGIVIGTRNRLEILKKCLKALVGKINTHHQIIVVDAGSTDGTIDYVSGLTAVRLVCDGKPIGQAKSLNRIFRTLNTTYACWLSDDNVVQSGMLDLAVQILEQNHKIGMVALKVKDVINNPTDKPYIGSIYKTGVLNCNQGVIRSDVFQKIGYFDESFKNYGIDSDLTTKVMLSGYRVVYTKAVAIHHFRDHETEGGAISKTERTKNRDRVHQKHNAKYSYLIESDFSSKCIMQIKSLVWQGIKTLNKALVKKGSRIEMFTGKNRKDWKNLTHCRYNSIFDFFFNRNHPYYLEQRIPKKILLSHKNPYKGLIP